MARILVAGAQGSMAQSAVLQRLVARVRDDGHDGVLYGTHEETPLAALQESDALIAVLDGSDARTAAAIAFAHALHRPCLGLHGPRAPDALLTEGCTTLAPGVDEADWIAALPDFYAAVRPFAGRLVRDLVPRLVKEAGHDVTFRELPPEDRARHLKQKIVEEAVELSEADAGAEKEELADVLEALEAFIRVRDIPRDDLKAVKDHKRKRRGGFEKFYVVEATARAGRIAPTESEGRPEREPPQTRAAAVAPSRRGPRADAPPRADDGQATADAPRDGSTGRKIEPRFFEI